VNLPQGLPNIHLHHREAVWVIEQLGYRGNAGKKTFNEYVRALRKLGIPFGPGQIGLVHRGFANYSYCHLMELALACRLRAYHAVPDSALRQLVRHRTRLRRLFRQAYEQRLSGLGAPIKIKSDRYGSVYLRGVSYIPHPDRAIFAERGAGWPG